MVYGTILKEKVWTKKNDKIKAAQNTINYGLQGNDSYLPLKKGSFNVSVGGPGNDKYIGGNNPFGVFIIENGDSPKDFGSSKGSLFDSNARFFTIDGRHLAVINPVTKQEIYLIDFTKPENQIETIKTADGTFTIDELTTQLPELPGFEGDKTWKLAIQNSDYLSKVGLTKQKKVNKFLNAVVKQADLLESGKTKDVLLGEPVVGVDRGDRLTRSQNIEYAVSEPSRLEINAASTSAYDPCLEQDYLDTCLGAGGPIQDVNDPFCRQGSTCLDLVAGGAPLFPDATQLI